MHIPSNPSCSHPAQGETQQSNSCLSNLFLLMHLSRPFEIKGSDKFSATPRPLLTSCSCRVMSCKPQPSALSWGTEQPSQCPALQLSLQPRGQRGSRAFLRNWTETQTPLSSCPTKFPGCPGDGILHREVTLPRSRGQAGTVLSKETRLELVLGRSTALSLRANT